MLFAQQYLREKKFEYAHLWISVAHMEQVYLRWGFEVIDRVVLKGHASPIMRIKL